MIPVRLRAAAHELRCTECRVTWTSWVLRATHLGGMTPTPRKGRR